MDVHGDGDGDGVMVMAMAGDDALTNDDHLFHRPQ